MDAESFWEGNSQVSMRALQMRPHSNHPLSVRVTVHAATSESYFKTNSLESLPALQICTNDIGQNPNIEKGQQDLCDSFHSRTSYASQSNTKTV